MRPRLPDLIAEYAEAMAQGDVFARELMGVSDKTASRMNLPTTYIGSLAYVLKNASLKIVAERVRRRNEPAKPRRAR